MLADCINSVVDQVDRVIVIDNLSSPPIDPEPWHGNVGVVSVPIDPPNISTLWNVGIALADASAHAEQAKRWDIAVLNSDVVVPPGWIDHLSAAVRSTPAALAYPDQHGGTRQILHTRAEPIEHDGGEPFGSRINRRRHAGWTCADDRQIHFITRTIAPHAGAFGERLQIWIEQHFSAAAFDHRRFPGRSPLFQQFLPGIGSGVIPRKRHKILEKEFPHRGRIAAFPIRSDWREHEGAVRCVSTDTPRVVSG